LYESLFITIRHTRGGPCSFVIYLKVFGGVQKVIKILKVLQIFTKMIINSQMGGPIFLKLTNYSAHNIWKTPFYFFLWASQSWRFLAKIWTSCFCMMWSRMAGGILSLTIALWARSQGGRSTVNDLTIAGIIGNQGIAALPFLRRHGDGLDRLEHSTDRRRE